MNRTRSERVRRAATRMLWAAVVMGAAAFATGLGASAPPDNLLVQNPSFEVDADNDGFADGWKAYTSVGSASLSAAEVFDGSYSQQVVARGGTTSAPRIMSALVPVTQNQPYTFAFWFKADPGVRAIANIKGFNAVGGEVSGDGSVTLVANGGWQRAFVSHTFTNASQVQASGLAGLRFNDAGRVIHVDAAAFAPDTDRDGAFDTQDACPGTVPGTIVLDNGCPNSPPTANAGPDQTVEATGPGGAVVTLNGTQSSDPDEGQALTYAWSVPLGTATGPVVNVTFPLGVHDVGLTVSDGFGGSDADSATVTVVDTTPPVVTARPSVSTLWPPNHQMVPVAILTPARDAADPRPVCQVTSVISSEPADGLGDGDTGPDWVVTGPLQVSLRSERAGGGSGRVYTLTVQCADASQNTASKTVTVSVPKSQGR